MSLLLEVLEWTDHEPDEMVHRIPGEGSADIKMGAQLIVQMGQSALFSGTGSAWTASARDDTCSPPSISRS